MFLQTYSSISDIYMDGNQQCTIIIRLCGWKDHGGGVLYISRGDFNCMRTFKRHLASGHRVSSQSNRIWHTSLPWKGHTVRLEVRGTRKNHKGKVKILETTKFVSSVRSFLRPLAQASLLRFHSCLRHSRSELLQHHLCNKQTMQHLKSQWPCDDIWRHERHLQI